MNREYVKISDLKKRGLIKNALIDKKGTIKQVAHAMGIKYENAKLICRQYKDGKTFESEFRNQSKKPK